MVDEARILADCETMRLRSEWDTSPASALENSMWQHVHALLAERKQLLAELEIERNKLAESQSTREEESPQEQNLEEGYPDWEPIPGDWEYRPDYRILTIRLNNVSERPRRRDD